MKCKTNISKTKSTKTDAIYLFRRVSDWERFSCCCLSQSALLNLLSKSCRQTNKVNFEKKGRIRWALRAWRSYPPSPPGCTRPRGRRPSCSSGSRWGCTKKCTAPKQHTNCVRLSTPRHTDLPRQLRIKPEGGSKKTKTKVLCMFSCRDWKSWQKLARRAKEEAIEESMRP